MADELVTIDGFPLTGQTREGMWKRLEEFEGWFDSPEPRRDSVSYVNGDGDIATDVFYEPRLLTYQGRVTSTNHDYLHEAGMRVTALPGRGNKKLFVRGHGPAQWAMVDPRGKVSVRFPTDTRMEFQLPLEAVDPFKYGESRDFGVALGSSVSVFHRGTVPSWPIITVAGSAPGGYAVSLGGRLVRVTAPLVSGSPHTLDMRTGILRAGGSRVHSGIAEAEYFAVPPGSPSVFVTSFNTTGSANVSMSLNDTYI